MCSLLLRSGREVLVRPIRADDHARLTAAHERLSPESRYRRFLGVKPRLSAGDVHYLVDVDARDHVALVATPPREPAPIVAVARFVRLAEDPRAAEFSIVVGDAYQRDGLGVQLLAGLAGVAADNGVERFVATILAENEGAHRLVEAVAAGTPRWIRHGPVDEVEFELAPAARLAA